MKEMFIEEYDRLYSEAMDSGEPINEDKLSDLAYNKSRDRFADMCDQAKDRAKYSQ